MLFQGLATTDGYQPCADDYADTYLNTASVKAAMHVKSALSWASCSNKISYNSTDSNSVSTAPIYNYLVDGGFGLNILVYSGDDDSVCATIGMVLCMYIYKISLCMQSIMHYITIQYNVL